MNRLLARFCNHRCHLFLSYLKQGDIKGLFIRIRAYLGRKPLVQKLYSHFRPEEQESSNRHKPVDFFNFIFTQNNQPSKEYQNFQPHQSLIAEKNVSAEQLLRFIAFYLPQFHPIPENDAWWGKGFTEWTNVSKAVPQFADHYQPRLPGALGYYDLRLSQTMHAQVKLAKNYGLSGFCFHYYWFNGKKVLDLPLTNYLNDPTLDFPFCINWANENWTRRWDGKDEDILLKQNYNHKDDLEFIQSVSQMFSDPRYIRINDKPVLLIYRTALFPDISKTAQIWRDYCLQSGIGEIYLVLTHSFEAINPDTIGFDAAVEFTPNTFPMTPVNHKQYFFNQDYNGMVFDYQEAIQISHSRGTSEYKKFRTLCPGWDNEARRPGKGISFINSTPSLFLKWLNYLCYDTHYQFNNQERLIFINAWNEWAEGAYMEPDQRFGHAYLESLYLAQDNFYKKLEFFEQQHQPEKISDIAVICHLYYFSIWPEIESSLKNIPENFDLYLNVHYELSLSDVLTLKNSFPNVFISCYKNQGRDILPFVKIMKEIEAFNYRLICKIHTKKSPHRVDGEQWRNHLILSILGSTQTVQNILNRFAHNNRLGLVAASGNLHSFKKDKWNNIRHLRRFSAKSHYEIPQDFVFPAGSMFWFRPEAIQGLLQHISEDDFEQELNQTDDTFAHAFERLVGISLIKQNMTAEEI